MNCAGCPLKIRPNEDVISCRSKTCKQTFHAACIQTQRLTTEEVKTWICPDCHAKNKKGGDNSHTPVRNPTENVTLRSKPASQRSGTSTSRSAGAVTASAGTASTATGAAAAAAVAAAAAASAATDAGGTPTTLPLSPADELHLLSLEITQFRQSASETWGSLTARLDNINEKISKFELNMKEIETLKIENIDLKATVTGLQNQLSSQAQSLLRNEVEVLGLEEYPNENPYHLALTTAVKLGVNLQEEDLMYVSRAGPKHRDVTNSDGTIKRLQRPLVVAFTRRVKRDELLKQGKVRRNIYSNDIVGQGPDRRVYVNERLTNENRRLFRSTREFAHTHKYKYCWTHNGNIFIRRKDISQGSPAIRICSEEDFIRLSGTATTGRETPSCDSKSTDIMQTPSYDNKSS